MFGKLIKIIPKIFSKINIYKYRYPVIENGPDPKISR